MKPTPQIYRASKIILFWMLLLIVPDGNLIAQEVNPKAVRHFEKALEARRDDNAAKALRELDKALTLSPHFLDARRLRIGTNEALQDWQACIRDLDTLLGAAPDDFEARFIRAEIYAELGTPLLGVPDMDTILANKDIEMGARIEVQCMKASLLTAGGQLKEALQNLNMALKLNPSWGEGHLLRARLEEQIRDFDNARSDYGLAIELSYPKGRAYFGRACFWLHQGKEAEACKDLEAALAAGFSPEATDQAAWEELRKACNLVIKN
jgi:tetratricopeptide (TPR) repeat protein